MKLFVAVVVAVGAAVGFVACAWVMEAHTTDCKAVQTAYASALAEAQFCDLTVPDSCSATRPKAPQDVCRCQVAVNPARTAEVDRLLAQFQSQACPLDQSVCNRACTAPISRCATGARSSPSCD